MKTRSIIVFIQVVALAVLLGCRPVVDVERPGDYGWYPDGSSYFSTTFESFWSGMNVNYVFWDLEPTDYWDNVWDTYKPKFDALSSELTSEAAFKTAKDKAYEYFREMLYPLKDGHLVVVFDNDDPDYPVHKPYDNGGARADARYDNRPADENPKRAFWSNWSGVPNTQNSFNYKITETIKNYVDFDGNIAGMDASVKAPGGFRIATGHISTGSGFILYFYFSSFDLAKNTADANFRGIIEKYLADIADPDLEGVILDLRGNAGGSTTDIDLVLNRLIHEPLLFAYTRYKNGPNRLDYKPWLPYYINPHSESSERVQNDIPVVALINDYSLSCGELTPLAVHFMPKGHLVGTRTWGATGLRFGDVSPATVNGGSFSNKNGSTFWQQVVQAGYQTKGRDGTNYEGIGITPDEEVEFDWNEFYGDGAGSGRDRQLVAAIKHIYPAYTAP